MARFFIDFKFVSGQVEKLKSNIINFYESIKRNVFGHMSQVNETTVLDAFKEGVREALKKVGYKSSGPRMDNIMDGFRVKKVESMQGKSKLFSFKVDNTYNRSSATFIYTNPYSGRKYIVLKSTVLATIDTGRAGGTSIGRGGNGAKQGLYSPRTYSHVLRWKRNRGKSPVGFAFWPNTKIPGPFRQGPMTGAGIFKAGEDAIGRMIEAKRKKIASLGRI